MFSITTSNETGQIKQRVKSLVEVETKKKFVKNKWRRLCSVNKCEKQVQRKGLCARHLTENKNRQQSTRSTAISRRSSTDSTKEEMGTISNNPTDLATPIENYAEQNTLYGYGEFFCFIN
jgi:hypothetical protein